MSNCRRCLTQQHDVISAEGEVRRLARLMARTTNPGKLSTYKDQLAVAKTQRAEAKAYVEQGHECNNLLSDEHWTKKRA